MNRLALILVTTLASPVVSPPTAEALGTKRPYTNLKTYLEYKNRGIDTLKAHAKEIARLAENEPAGEEDEP